MKKSTQNLLILGVAGVGAYYFIIKPRLEAAGQLKEAVETGGGTGGFMGLPDSNNNGLWGALNPFEFLTDLTKGTQQATSSFITGITNPKAVKQAVVIPSYNAGGLSYGSGAKTAVGLGVPITAINPALLDKYTSSKGNTILGTYNAKTGVFIDTAGFGYSTAPAHVKAPTYATPKVSAAATFTGTTTKAPAVSYKKYNPYFR